MILVGLAQLGGTASVNLLADWLDRPKNSVEVSLHHFSQHMPVAGPPRVKRVGRGTYALTSYGKRVALRKR